MQSGALRATKNGLAQEVPWRDLFPWLTVSLDWTFFFARLGI